MDAALALWSYCRASASLVCERVGGPSRDVTAELLAGIAGAGERGLSLSEQLDLFARNVSAGRLRSARDALEQSGRIVSTRERRAGAARAITVTRVTDRAPSAPPGSSNS